MSLGLAVAIGVLAGTAVGVVLGIAVFVHDLRRS